MLPSRNQHIEEEANPDDQERTRPIFLTLVLICATINTCVQFWHDLFVLPDLYWLPLYLSMLILIPYIANLYAIFQVWTWRKRGIYLYYALLLINWCLSVYVIHNMKAMLLAIIPAIIFTLSILPCYDEFE